MNVKYTLIYSKTVLLLIVFQLSVFTTYAQQIPSTPLSHRLFSPFILNPAMAGSKDFTNINLIAAWQDKTVSQLLSADTRLTKPGPRYFSSGNIREFRNIGTGGALFNSINGGNGSAGGLATGSLHIPLSPGALSFLSFGASFKGVYSMLDVSNPDEVDLPPSSESLFYYNLDLGAYYYGSNFYAGFSALNILENHMDPEEPGKFGLPDIRQYYFLSGYKILLSHTMNIVLEPSVMITANDTTFNEIGSNISPLLKLYLMDFVLGALYEDKNKFSFFFQYRYPGFFIGAFFNFPVKSAYYINSPLVEINAGINLTRERRYYRGRW